MSRQDDLNNLRREIQSSELSTAMAREGLRQAEAAARERAIQAFTDWIATFEHDYTQSCELVSLGPVCFNTHISANGRMTVKLEFKGIMHEREEIEK